MKVAIIGAGISGLSIAKIIKNSNDVTIYESDSRPGGMIKCDVINGCLFHRTGGHVFNTKRDDVLKWFWKQFNKDKDFNNTLRNASVYMSEGRIIPYPIENHVYCFEDSILKSFIHDLVLIAQMGDNKSNNFEDFLQNKFGQTLYRLYFQPYNYKIWRNDLKKIPLSWLEGKLPMPTVEEMIYNNINHIEERKFIHSSFYYPNIGGSQFIADKLAEGLDIRYNSFVSYIMQKNDKWEINNETYDHVIYCGNIKKLPELLDTQINIEGYYKDIEALEYHGTTSVFCEIEKNPYSWIYLPNSFYESHRIICTGNFAKSNNANGKMTATVEFTDYVSKEDILINLSRTPYSPQYITHHYEKYTYPIQNNTTRKMISSLKEKLKKHRFYLLGRFAEWEYYNMDAAIGAAIDLNKHL
jgi:protoporphyrinogen oxidase